MSNIYHLQRPGRCSLDEVWEFVIVAPSERVARRLASTVPGDEGGDVWTDKEQSSCATIGVSTCGDLTRVVVRHLVPG